MNTKKLDNKRKEIMESVKGLLNDNQYDVLLTGSNEIAIPIVGEDNEEGYLVITFKIPKGSRDGEEYNGYYAANDYAHKVAEKLEKEKIKEKKKAEKIARDKAKREKGE